MRLKTKSVYFLSWLVNFLVGLNRVELLSGLYKRPVLTVERQAQVPGIISKMCQIYLNLKLCVTISANMSLGIEACIRSGCIWAQKSNGGLGQPPKGEHFCVWNLTPQDVLKTGCTTATVHAFSGTFANELQFGTMTQEGFKPKVDPQYSPENHPLRAPRS